MTTLQAQVDELLKKHGYEPVRDALMTVLRREALIEVYRNIQNRTKGEND